MTKEALVDKPDLEPMATGLAATYFQRGDMYAKQLEDGSYICIRKTLEISTDPNGSPSIWVLMPLSPSYVSKISLTFAIKVLASSRISLAPTRLMGANGA